MWCRAKVLKALPFVHGDRRLLLERRLEGPADHVAEPLHGVMMTRRRRARSVFDQIEPQLPTRLLRKIALAEQGPLDRIGHLYGALCRRRLVRAASNDAQGEE